MILDFYTLHPIQIHQLSFLPHQASEKKLPTTRKLRWRFPQKRWTFFQKTPTFFCFSPTFFHFSRRKTKKIATFSNGKKQGLMPFHQDSYLGYSIIRRKHDFLEKSQLLFVQTNKILYLCDVASKSTAHTLPAKSGVLCSLPYLGLPRPLISLRYTTITTDFAIKSRSKRIRNNPSSLNKHVIRKNFYCKASTLNLSPTPQLRHAVVKFLLYDNLLL